MSRDQKKQVNKSPGLLETAQKLTGSGLADPTAMGSSAGVVEEGTSVNAGPGDSAGEREKVLEWTSAVLHPVSCPADEMVGSREASARCGPSWDRGSFGDGG